MIMICILNFTYYNKCHLSSVIGIYMASQLKLICIAILFVLTTCDKFNKNVTL